MTWKLNIGIVTASCDVRFAGFWIQKGMSCRIAKTFNLVSNTQFICPLHSSFVHFISIVWQMRNIRGASTFSGVHAVSVFICSACMFEDQRQSTEIIRTLYYSFPLDMPMQMLQPHQPQCMHIEQISSY